MAEAKSTRKKTASKAGAAKKSAAPKTAAAKAETVSRGTGLRATTPGTTLATLRENAGHARSACASVAATVRAW